MTKNGNALEISSGQFAELASAVIRALPRDLETGQAQKWISDMHALSLALRKTLITPVTYTLIVDYVQSVEEALKAGNYDWVSPYLTSQNFPPIRRARRNTETVEAHILHFGRRMTNEEIDAELDKLNMRDGEVEDLLTLGAKHPNLQRQRFIVARGSVDVHRYGDSYVPGLWDDRSYRSAGTLRFEDIWLSDYHFLAVSK